MSNWVLRETLLLTGQLVGELRKGGNQWPVGLHSWPVAWWLDHPTPYTGSTGPVESASHVETSVTQLVQQFTIRAQVRGCCLAGKPLVVWKAYSQAVAEVTKGLFMLAGGRPQACACTQLCPAACALKICAQSPTLHQPDKRIESVSRCARCTASTASASTARSAWPTRWATWPAWPRGCARCRPASR